MKKVINFRYPFYCFLALLFGAVVAKSLYGGVIESLILVIFSLVFISIVAICYKKFIPFIMVVIFFFAGNGLFFLGLNSYFSKSFEGDCSIVGRVCDTSFVKEDYYSNVIIENVTINGESTKNIKLFISGKSDVEVGDIIAFESEVENISLFTLGNFNSSFYRNNIGYSSSIQASDIVITKGQLNIDESFRLKVKDALFSSMSEDNAYIAYAVLFGDKSMIDDEITQVYRSSGIIHVLTVSGLHISFIVGVLMLFMKLFKANKFVSMIVMSIILLCYCYLCAFSPSVVRASIMAIILCLAKISNRPYDGLNSLAIAGFIIVLARPLSVVDIGFLMSFFCVMSILLLEKPFSRLLSKIMPNKIAQLIAVSVSAQIGILPFVSSFFSNFNFLSVFANLIVIPIFSFVFPLLFVMAFLVAIFPFISPIFVIFNFFFNLIFAIASFFASSSLQVPLKPFSLSLSAFIVIFLFVLSSFFVVKPLYRLLVAGIVSLGLALSIILPNVDFNTFTSMSFVNSYNGPMIVLTSKNGDSLYYGDDYYYQTFSELDKKFSVDYYLADSLSSSDCEKWKDYGAKLLLSSIVDESDECQLQVKEEAISVGSFTLSFYEQMYTIEYDDLKVLIACNAKNSSFSLINFSEYDIIYLGDNVLNEKVSPIAITNSQKDFSSYSFDSYGNFGLYGKDLMLRRLD